MLAADGTDQAAGVLIAAQIDELEIVQQAGLQLDQLNPSPQGFEDRQPVGLKPAPLGIACCTCGGAAFFFFSVAATR